MTPEQRIKKRATSKKIIKVKIPIPILQENKKKQIENNNKEDLKTLAKEMAGEIIKEVLSNLPRAQVQYVNNNETSKINNSKLNNLEIPDTIKLDRGNMQVSGSIKIEQESDESDLDEILKSLEGK